MVTPHVPPGKALTRDGAADVLEAHLISQIDWNKFWKVLQVWKSKWKLLAQNENENLRGTFQI